MIDEALNIQIYKIFIHIYCNRTVYRQSIVAMWNSELTVSVSPRGVRQVMFVLAMMWFRYSRRSKILVLIATLDRKMDRQVVRVSVACVSQGYRGDNCLHSSMCFMLHPQHVSSID